MLNVRRGPTLKIILSANVSFKMNTASWTTCRLSSRLAVSATAGMYSFNRNARIAPRALSLVDRLGDSRLAGKSDVFRRAGGTLMAVCTMKELFVASSRKRCVTCQSLSRCSSLPEFALVLKIFVAEDTRTDLHRRRQACLRNYAPCQACC